MVNLNLEKQIAKTKVREVHGLCKTRLYRIFKKMRERCYIPSTDSYKYYGARGIKICDEWLNDFTKFYDWSLANGYADNLSIDRKNVDGDYTALNCKWATPKEQGNNRRDCRYVTINGVTKSFTDWCSVYNISIRTARGRLRSGWTDIMAITIPAGTAWENRSLIHPKKMNPEQKRIEKAIKLFSTIY